MNKTLTFILFIFLGVALFACNEKKEMQESNINKVDSSNIQESNEKKIKEIVEEDSNKPDISELQNAIKKMLESELATMTEADRKFTYAQNDLNGDNKKETLVLFQGPYFCGSGGCTMYLLDENYKKLSDFSVSSTPIQVAVTVSNGWKDLLITSGGKLHVMKNNGKKYPGNPSVEPEYTGDGKKDTRVDFSVEYTF